MSYLAKAVLFVLVLTATANGQWIQWSVSEAGNGHWYRLTALNSSWEENEAEATAAGGHLVAIGSAAENDWILTTFGISDMGLAIGLAQQPGSLEPDQGWGWANGEPVAYTNWRVCCPQEPNNLFHAGLPPEDVAYMHWPNHPNAGTWYDAPSSDSQGVIERITDPNNTVGVLGGRIAFSVGPHPSEQLWILDLSTGVSSHIPLDRNVRGPSWCRNGQLIAFTTGGSGGDRVNTVKPDGSDVRDVTHAPFGGEVSVSGDCSEIAFHAIAGGFRVHTVHADGLNRAVLNAPGSSAEWSPVAPKIVYSSWPTAGGTSELFVYDLTTGLSTQITNHAPNRFHRTAWSPDGLRLAASDFNTGTGRQDIWVMNADGSNPVNVTSDWTTSSEGYPSWSADGQHIVFSSDRFGEVDIWAMRPDGSERVNLTDTAGVDESGPAIGPPSNAPPTADAVVEQLTGIGAQAVVRLDGSGSSDPDNLVSELTFTWTVDAVVVCDGTDVQCAIIEVPLSFGAHAVVLRVTDPDGAFDEATTNVTLDPSMLSVFEIDKVKVEFGQLPPRLKIKGQIGLPFGVNFSELFPMASASVNLAGVNVLPPTSVAFDIEPGEPNEWTFRDPLGQISKFDINWEGTRFAFHEPGFPVKLKSQVITTSETVLGMKFDMSGIGGAFSMDIGGPGHGGRGRGR